MQIIQERHNMANKNHQHSKHFISPGLQFVMRKQLLVCILEKEIKVEMCEHYPQYQRIIVSY